MSQKSEQVISGLKSLFSAAETAANRGSPAGLYFDAYRGRRQLIIDSLQITHPDQIQSPGLSNSSRRLIASGLIMDGSIRLMGFDSQPSPEKTGKVRLEMSGPRHRVGPEIIAGYDNGGRAVNLTVSLSKAGDAQSFDVFAHLLR